jgi:hypothetical protein
MKFVMSYLLDVRGHWGEIKYCCGLLAMNWMKNLRGTMLAVLKSSVPIFQVYTKICEYIVYCNFSWLMVNGPKPVSLVYFFIIGYWLD